MIMLASDLVTIGSLSHLLPIIFAFVFGLVVIRYAKTLALKNQQKLIHVIAIFVAVSFFGYDVLRVIEGTFNFKTNLPLFLCNLLALLCPVFTYYRTYWMFEILVFWIIGGTLQAVITPDIEGAVFSYAYFRYWIEHLGLLVIIFYFIFVFNMRPKHRSIYKSFFALQIYIVVVAVLNYILDANYSYLMEKPNSATVLDYFGDWPYYILVCYMIIFPLFYLIYLPFYLSNKFTWQKVDLYP